MKDCKTSLRGEDGFNSYYEAIFGERWNSLRTALAQKNDPVEYFIPGARKSYFLDSASVAAALCLPLGGAEKILDLCAAPGGKTLVLASRMDGGATLLANERSPDRKRRLCQVTEECLPVEIQERVRVLCSDGARLCTRETDAYDRILLDAPCSSERHVMADKKYLDQWSPSRLKTVSMEQWALLSSAFRLLRTNGILLYSTCALSENENDAIIRRLLKKFGEDSARLLQPKPEESEIRAFTSISLPGYEKTELGFQILPDRQQGAGPIYFSIVQKLRPIS